MVSSIPVVSKVGIFWKPWDGSWNCIICFSSDCWGGYRSRRCMLMQQFTLIDFLMWTCWVAKIEQCLAIIVLIHCFRQSIVLTSLAIDLCVWGLGFPFLVLSLTIVWYQGYITVAKMHLEVFLSFPIFLWYQLSLFLILILWMSNEAIIFWNFNALSLIH